MLSVLANDEHAIGGAFRHRLQHIGRLQHMLFRSIQPAHHLAMRHRHASSLHDDLGHLLVHGHGRCHDAGMGIGNLQNFQHALDRTVLAIGTVQGVKGGIGFQRRKRGCGIAIDINAGDLEPFAFQRLGAGVAGAQGNLPLRRPAAHQYRHVLCHASSRYGPGDKRTDRFASTVVRKMEMIC